jgi:hypothetical protein
VIKKEEIVFLSLNGTLLNCMQKMVWDILGIYDWDIFGLYMGYIWDVLI